MARTRCEVRFTTARAEADWTERGLEHAEFYISPNPGEDLKPLARIASGGELSRIMLALKTLGSSDALGKDADLRRGRHRNRWGSRGRCRGEVAEPGQAISGAVHHTPPSDCRLRGDASVDCEVGPPGQDRHASRSTGGRSAAGGTRPHDWRQRCVGRRAGERARNARNPERRGERRINGKRRKRRRVSGIPMKYLIETHGCQMNVHDSERMAGLLEQAGYESTEDDGDADVIVINTCSVRERAEEKLFTRLGEIRQAGIERGARPVVAVAGCVAQQEGRQILARSSAVDVIIGTQNLKRLPMLVEQATAAGAGTRTIVDIDPLDPLDNVSFPLGVARRSERFKAYVTIIEGMQRVLRVLRRAVHAWSRADASGRGDRCRGATSGRARAPSKFSSLGRSSTTIRHPTIPPATSRHSSNASTTSRDSRASGLPAHIHAT